MENSIDFTQEELEMLMDAPFLIGITVSDADVNGASSSRELEALLKACGDAREEYPDNPLIQEVIGNIHWLSDMDEPEDDPEEVLEHFRNVAKILDEKRPGNEGAEFKKFLIGIARKVASAYGENFLGMGAKVSIREAAMIEKLENALGI